MRLADPGPSRPRQHDLRHDRRRHDFGQQIVEPTICDQFVSSARAALQCSAAIAASTANGPGSPRKRFLNEGKRFVDLWSVPECAILFFEHNEIAFFIQSSLASRVVQQHQRDERGCFSGWFGFEQRPRRRPSRIASAQRSRPDEWLAASRCITFGEDQIDCS